jgi:hypothetical protein
VDHKQIESSIELAKQLWAFVFYVADYFIEWFVLWVVTIAQLHEKLVVRGPVHGSSMGRLLSRKQGEIAVGTAKHGLRKNRHKEMDSPAPFSGYTNRDVI